MDIFRSVSNIINFKSEDEETLIDLIITHFGIIFRINKFNSVPTMGILTLQNVINKLNELEYKKVYNLVKNDEIDLFDEKVIKIKQNIGDNILIEINTEDLFDVMIKVFGIDKLKL